MKRRIESITVIICSLLLSSVCAAAATKDRELILDVAGLTKAMQDATQSVYGRMKSSKLKERFERVTEILGQKETDKEQLVSALVALQGEMEAFTSNWEEVVKPLWDGQEALGGTIDRIRHLMGKASAKEPNAKTASLIKNYDRRLTALARAVEAEKDPMRRRRLKATFASILSLRTLTEKFGSVNLDSASMAVQGKTINALAGLQDQLLLATFEVEKVRAVFVNESEFISSYVGVLRGLVDAEKLAKALSEMRGAGTDMGSLAIAVGDLRERTEEFASQMDEFASSVAESIETETAKIAAREGTTSELDPVDIDEQIRKYASKGNSSVAEEDRPVESD